MQSSKSQFTKWQTVPQHYITSTVSRDSSFSFLTSHTLLTIRAKLLTQKFHIYFEKLILHSMNHNLLPVWCKDANSHVLGLCFTWKRVGGTIFFARWLCTWSTAFLENGWKKKQKIKNHGVIKNATWTVVSVLLPLCKKAVLWVNMLLLLLLGGSRGSWVCVGHF